jgi:hypothetical protein
MALHGKMFWAVLVVSLAAALPYLNTIGHYFSGDDYGYVRLNARESFDTDFLSLFWTDWTRGIWGQQTDELRPTIALSYWFDSHWGAGSPTAYSVSNVVFHVLNALLVLGIGRVVGLSLLAATFAGSFFAVLAIHAETVAWITGRNDSLFALLYLLTFLAYALWRRSGTRWLYGLSLAAFFLALYSKQSAITMVGTLVLYDAFVASRSGQGAPSPVCPDVSVVERTPIEERRSWYLSLSRLCPYVPFAVLTASYLVLRQVVFQSAVREDRVSLNTLWEFGDFQATQLQILVFGRRVIEHGAVEGLVWVALALAVLWGGVELNRGRKGGGPSPRAVVFYFGVLWWLVNTTPLLVTYLAGRHLYLAAVGPVIALGVLIDALWSRGHSPWRVVAVVAGVGLILASAARLQLAIADWNATARVSEMMVRGVERELSVPQSGVSLCLMFPERCWGGRRTPGSRVGPCLTHCSRHLRTWI